MTKLDDALIDRYFTAKDDIHKGFDYESNWVEIPLSDEREYYWMLIGGEGHHAICVWSDVPFTRKSIEAGAHYSGPVYTQRFLPKWVYRTPKYVLVSVNTQTDGNKFLMIFRADRECTDENMKDIYTKNWI